MIKRPSIKKHSKIAILSTCAVFILLALGSAPAVAAELKIGYADLQKALNNCEAGKKAKTELDKEYNYLEKKLGDEQKGLKKLKDEIEAKRSVWNKETREKKEGEFMAKAEAFQKRFVDAREGLNAKLKKTEAEILSQLQMIVVEVAEKKGLDYVLESSLGAILHAPKDAEITEEIITIHNRRN